MTTSTYVVERSTTVRADAAEIYPHIADLHRWAAWSPWEDLDPSMARSYSDDGTLYTWSGNRKAGQGRMEITGAAPPGRVTIAVEFRRPFPSSSESTFLLEPDGDGTRVTWRMVGPATRMTKVMGLFTSMDTMIGPDFEKGLERLRATVEARG